MKKVLLTLLITLFISTNSSYAKERFIPIELWLGIPSTGSNELKFYEVNNKQHGGKLKVSGPNNWPKKKSGGSSTSKRTGMKKTLTIKKLGDEKDCLTFRWQLTIIGGKKSGKVIDDNDYTYCPNKGFTKLVSRK